jgi:hypothetical protein
MGRASRRATDRLRKIGHCQPLDAYLMARNDMHIVFSPAGLVPMHARRFPTLMSVGFFSARSIPTTMHWFAFFCLHVALPSDASDHS